MLYHTNDMKDSEMNTQGTKNYNVDIDSVQELQDAEKESPRIATAGQ